MDEHRIEGDRLSATIRALGAEPTSLVHSATGEMLWQAGPAWPRHAPVLFPIVGALAGDAYVHEGKSYALGRHGFARNLAFSWMHREGRSCELRLADTPETLASYPFRFELTIRYEIVGDALDITYGIGNPGDTSLPASLGGHPAFRWPLAAGVAKSDHEIVFATDEPEPIRRLDGALLDPRPYPSPIRGNTLALDPALFDADAIIMDRPKSSSLRFVAPGAPSIEVSWRGFEQLGLWSKREGDFLCIEPWYGFASPTDFAGDFVMKPGLMHVAPGETRTFGIRVTVAPS